MKLPKGLAKSPVVLVTGDDESVIRDTVVAVDRVLVAEMDRSSCLEDLSLRGGTEDANVTVESIVAAAATPAFLSPRRVVVARHCGSLTTKEQVAPLVEYLGNPLDTTSVVLVWDVAAGSGARKGPPPKSLLGAIKACGGVVIETARGKKGTEWVSAQLAGESFQLDAAATARLVDHVGEQPNVLVGVLTTMRGVFGEGQIVGVADLEPLLGITGDVPPWDLTDAISDGDVAGALVTLHRMMVGGERHPLAVLASLTTYVGHLVALDGALLSGREDAARVIGAAPFVASKALAQSRRLGSERIADLATLVARADLDIKGGSKLDPGLVVEVLVARMASRSGTSRKRAGSGAERGKRAGR